MKVRESPPPETVTVAVREPPVLAAAVMLKVPLLLPEEGEMDNHAPFEEAVHATFAVTDLLWLPPSGGADHWAVSTSRITGG